MKKVLILEGSPRRNGNSAILSDEFARGAQEAGCSVEKIRIAGKKGRRMPRMQRLLSQRRNLRAKGRYGGNQGENAGGGRDRARLAHFFIP